MYTVGTNNDAGAPKDNGDIFCSRHCGCVSLLMTDDREPTSNPRTAASLRTCS